MNYNLQYWIFPFNLVCFLGIEMWPEAIQISWCCKLIKIDTRHHVMHWKKCYLILEEAKLYYHKSNSVIYPIGHN